MANEVYKRSNYRAKTRKAMEREYGDKPPRTKSGAPYSPNTYLARHDAHNNSLPGNSKKVDENHYLTMDSMQVRKRISQLSADQRIAFDAIERGENVCITGSGGTGKSFLLNIIRDIHNDNTVFVAPTGIAAVNIRGETIHSFFGIRPIVQQPTKRNISQDIIKKIRGTNCIIIDEISMVRADVFTAIDMICREAMEVDAPFGGIQIVAVGDFYQLPPVLTDNEKDVYREYFNSVYAFDTIAWKDAGFRLIDLEVSHRQENKTFFKMLNDIRSGRTHSQAAIGLINKVGMARELVDDDPWIMLATTNAIAEEYNKQEYLKCRAMCRVEHTFTARKQGNFNPASAPVDEVIKLCVGARVIIKMNNASGGYRNGSRGTITGFSRGESGDIVHVKLTTGESVNVTRATWTSGEYAITPQSNLQYTETGSFEQIPIKLGWAITIHSSQGMTLDYVVLNLGRGCFADGQLYVALSRVRDLKNFGLIQNIRQTDLRVSERVKWFYETSKI